MVFGDIGTSPLYAIREAFFGVHPLPPDRENVLGILSLIFWSLIVVVSLKYLVFVLRADNRGEGGIFALLSLLGARRAGAVTLLALVGASLLYGDGIITPAISVLSAVEGLEVATSTFRPVVLPLTVAILLLFFAVQRWGTGRLAMAYGWVMQGWFASLFLLGLRGVLLEPAVLEAANPAHALIFFERNGFDGFVALGAVVLCVTGAEAIYADLGHFGRSPIRWAWGLVVLPALLFNYAGQAAILLRDPGASHPFFALVPAPLLYPMVVLATTAAVVASQAVVSGAFSITRQAVQLGFLPRVRIVHTSRVIRGRIFVPTINRLLAVACVGAVLVFRDSDGLAAAYGLAVTGNMVITSLLYYLVARRSFAWSAAFALPLVGLFLVFDLGFLSANLVKLVHGGWVPALVATGLVLVMRSWEEGRRVLGAEVARRSPPLDVFLEELRERKPVRIPGTAVFLSSNPTGLSPAFVHHFRSIGVLHESVVFFTAVSVERPAVPNSERVDVQKLDAGMYRAIAYYGYMETPDVPRDVELVRQAGLPVDPAGVHYFLGRQVVVSTGTSDLAGWRKRLFLFLSRNAATAPSFFRLPAERVIEIGLEIEI